MCSTLLKAAALASAAALACADVFAIRDIPGPNIGTPRQRSIAHKLEAYERNPATFEAFWPEAEELLLLVCTDEELSYAKNRYVASDHNVGDRGAGSRSAAVLSANAMHHIVRGACTDRFRSDKARRACDLAMKILGSATVQAVNDVEEYKQRLEHLLTVCTTYLISGGKVDGGEDSLAWRQITTALALFALCGYAAFNAAVRGSRRDASSRKEVEEHLKATRDEVVKPTNKLFDEACPGVNMSGTQTACILAIATVGAWKKAESMVPCFTGTVFEASRSDLCSQSNRRFVDIPAQSWYLLVFILHCDRRCRITISSFSTGASLVDFPTVGLWLPFVGPVLAPVRYLWGMSIGYSLSQHLFGGTVCGPGQASATWYGCNFMYVRLTSDDYDALKEHLKGPHYCLDLYDENVLALIGRAARNGEAAGHVEFLETLFSSSANYHVKKTWV